MIKYNRKEIDDYYNLVALPKFESGDYGMAEVMFIMLYLKLCESQLGLETLLTNLTGEISYMAPVEPSEGHPHSEGHPQEDGPNGE